MSAFFFRDGTRISMLETWLSKRAYTSIFKGLRDSHGNPMIGLNFDRPNAEPERRGLIVVKNREAFKDVASIAQRFARIENDGHD